MTKASKTSMTKHQHQHQHQRQHQGDYNDDENENYKDIQELNDDESESNTNENNMYDDDDHDDEMNNLNLSAKSTDDLFLDSLHEDGDGLKMTKEEAVFFNNRKQVLAKELEDEKARSQKELSKAVMRRMAEQLRNGVPDLVNVNVNVDTDDVNVDDSNANANADDVDTNVDTNVADHESNTEIQSNTNIIAGASKSSEPYTLVSLSVAGSDDKSDDISFGGNDDDLSVDDDDHDDDASDNISKTSQSNEIAPQLSSGSVEDTLKEELQNNDNPMEINTDEEEQQQQEQQQQQQIQTQTKSLVVNNDEGSKEENQSNTKLNLSGTVRDIVTDDDDDDDETETETMQKTSSETTDIPSNCATNEIENENDDEPSSYPPNHEKGLLYKFLLDGFSYIKTNSTSTATATSTTATNSNSIKSHSPPSSHQTKPILNVHQSIFTKSLSQSPIVNFIDPTSISTSTNSPANISKDTSRRKAWNRSPTKPTIQNMSIYPKLNHIVQTKYRCTIKSIPYKNLRTNDTDTIERMPFSPKLNFNEFITDPTEWHRGPIAHVYIAACASIEHYRTKVRPALKAFVNQVDGGKQKQHHHTATTTTTTTTTTPNKKEASKEKGSRAAVMMKEQVAAANLAAAAAKDASGSNVSSQYLIIFVPIDPSLVDLSGDVEDAYRHGGIGLRKRLAAAAAARRNSTNNNNIEDARTFFDNDDVSVVSGYADDANTVGVSNRQQLSRDHKEVLNKFNIDFPNGRTCLISSLLDKDGSMAAETQTQNQEVSDFLRALGRAMISGFLDRIRHYNNELRKLSAEISMSSSTSSDSNFNWKRYFLMKESLAFIFEQMQLPTEALREYDELEYKLPVRMWTDIRFHGEMYTKISQIATVGDTQSFRNLVCSLQNLSDLSHIILDYLFARKAYFMFLGKDYCSIIKHFSKYMKSVYEVRKNQNYDDSNNSIAEAWCAGVCLEMKCAAETFLSCNLKVDTDVSEISDVEREAMSSLADVLNFARMRYLKLGDEVFKNKNLLRCAHDGRVHYISNQWVSWSEITRNNNNLTNKYEEYQGSKEVLEKLNGVDVLTPWILTALQSGRKYENMYMELCGVIIRLNKLIGRFRCAARILAEQAEVHIIRGEFDRAVESLMPTIDLCADDPWNSLFAWRLFRLICCQRISGNPADYLRTLSFCFGPRASIAMPSKMVNLIIDDLESVVKSEEVIGHTWGLSPLLGANMKIQATDGGEIVESSEILKRKIVKNVCYVGDEVTVELHVVSHLPRAITVSEMKVTLMKLKDFQQRYKSNDTVTEAEIFCTLDVGSSVEIQPGNNIYKLPWTVITVDQYIISSTQIQWHNATFIQDYSVSYRTAICFDVLPNEPTQSIELNPIFLIPGHVQNVRLFFNAGSDIVCGGKVELTCSQGIKVLPPEVNVENGDWKSKCTFNLEPCKPDEKITMIVTVKCDAIGSYDASHSLNDDDGIENSITQTLQAIIKTSYHHNLYASLNSGEAIEHPPMSAILAATVTTLKYPALTISDSNAYRYNENQVVVSATVHCNTPVPFSLKEWDITFPSPLCLEDGEDFNKGLFERSIIEGEELFFGFKCRLDFAEEKPDTTVKPLLNIVLQDSFGKTFSQVLPLSLEKFYDQVKNEHQRGTSNIANVQFNLSNQNGLVGSPVTFVCDIDCSNLTLTKDNSEVLFDVSCNNSDWILGGKVRGALCLSEDKSSSTLKFIGIPIKSGVIKRFPSLKLVHFTATNDSGTSQSRLPDIKVTSKYPVSFISSTHKSVETLSYLSLLDEI